MARPLEGLIRQDSIHAAGVVISKGPLTDHLPLMQKGDAEVVTQVSMTDVEKLGLLKMDFLGLRNLDVIDQRGRDHPGRRAARLRHRDHPAGRRRRPTGCWPRATRKGCSSSSRAACAKLCATSSPPGSTTSSPWWPSTGPGPWSTSRSTRATSATRPASRYEDPRLEPILSPTYGVAIYQEQLMEISKRDRRLHARPGRRPAQGHRQEDQAPRWTSWSPSSGRAPRPSGTAPKAIDYLWSLMEKAGDYSFNKSHAACYALISYRTAYLKANYPGAVHGRPHLQRHGHQGQGALLRDRGQRDGHRGAAARHQRVGARLPRGGGPHPLRSERRQERGRDAIRNILEARERGRAFPRPVRLLRAGGPGRRQREGAGEPGQVRGHGFHRPVPPGHAAGAAPGHGPRQEDAGRRRPGPGFHLRPVLTSPSRRPGQNGGRNGQRGARERRAAGGDPHATTSARKSCWPWRRRPWACT